MKKLASSSPSSSSGFRVTIVGLRVGGEIETVKEKMISEANDYVKLTELQSELESKENELNKTWERYEYLSQYTE